MGTIRYLVISDIHANQEAMEAVFRSVKRRKYEMVLCLGDLVGYGASPNPVLTKMRRFQRIAFVRGNHDKVCSGLEPGEDFNSSAKASARWTASKLRIDNKKFLTSLPKGPVNIGDGVMICHGSVVNEDTYMFSDFDAYEAFENTDFKVCFFGHTHIPCIFQRDSRGVEVYPLKEDETEIELDPDSRYLINPGSVGQPRNRVPKACFAEYYPEKRKLIFRRVEYDKEAAAEKIRNAGLPSNLANRLLIGS